MIPLRDSTHSNTFPIITIGIILINILIFVFQLSMGPEVMDEFLQAWGLIPAEYTSENGIHVSFLPFITYMFLHGSWMHVIGNMWSLWLFGDNLEDEMGHVNFLIFYLLCGLIAGLVHFFIFSTSEIPVVGASGAVAGVMGAYFLMFKKAKILTFIPPIFLINIPAWIYLGLWALSQVWGGAFAVLGTNEYSSVAFWAHIGGFAAGMLLYRTFLKKKKPTFFGTE